MITYLKKDVRTISNGIIAHGVNINGVMGAGIAYAISQTFPCIIKPYADVCAKKAQIGSVLTVKCDENLHICNIFTQELYKPASLDAIDSGLRTVVDLAWHRKLPLYTPKIGTLRGQRDWFTEVQPIFEGVASVYPDVNWTVIDI